MSACATCGVLALPFSLLVNPISAAAQEPEAPAAYIVSTFAGSSAAAQDWAKGQSLKTVYGIQLDSVGDLWIVDAGANQVWKATADGRMIHIAGTGEPGKAGDGGPATEAQLNSPRDIAFGPNGLVYISEGFNRQIRVLHPGGVITTLEPEPVDYGPEISNPKELYNPSFLSYDPSTGRLYIGESGQIRFIDENGRLHHFAGNRAPNHDEPEPAWRERDGISAVGANLFTLRGVLADGRGNVYFSQTKPARIWRVNAEGILSIVFDGTEGFAVDDTGDIHWIEEMGGLAQDRAGSIYFTDVTGGHVYSLDGPGLPTLVTQAEPGERRGPFYFPLAVAVSPQDELYLSQFSKGVVRRFRRGETGEIIAGGGNDPGDGGPATEARLFHPSDLSCDASGNLYIADRDNAAVRRVSPSGTIERLAGNGGRYADTSFKGKLASDVALGFIMKVAASPDGVYTLGNRTVRLVAPDRSVRHVVDIRSPGAQIYLADMLPDGRGGIYLSSSSSHRIWRYDMGQRELVEVVGTGKSGFATGGAAALDTTLLGPGSMAFDSQGRLYFIDGVREILRLERDGTLSIIAARPRVLKEGEKPTPVVDAQVQWPRDLTVGPDGNLYVSDGATIERIRLDGHGTALSVETIAGDGTAGFAGDGGPALKARFDFPTGLQFGADGRLYIADRNNHRVRVLTPAAPAGR